MSRASTLLLGTGLGLVVLAAPPVQAFCGTYVGGSGELYNSVSRVVLSRFDGRTTVTMANDISGDTTDFAVVVPVPEVPTEDEVRVVDPEVMRTFDRYSEPRVVSYQCEDFIPDEADADADTDADTDSDTDADTDVDVEASYIVGEYEVVVLSASESDALVTWLQDNSYTVPDASAALLQEYIDGGSYFFAAKVGAEAGIESGDELSPLQISYEADAWSLPIRLGTLNSPGTQDLLVYTLNDFGDGEAGISNYDEAVIEDSCLWESEGESFEEWYGDRLSEAHTQDGLNWVVEYSWGNAGCDPCNDGTPDGSDLFSMGVPEDRAHYSEFWLTRMHLRYSPRDVETALGFYSTKINQTRQQRYIEHAEELEEFFPRCDVGWTDPDQVCFPEDDDGGSDGGSDGLLDDDEESKESKGCGGCATGVKAPLSGLMLLPLALAGLRRRRA